MESYSPDLCFRSASRHDVALDATMVLRPPDNERVRFSRNAVSQDGSWHATVVDVSGGGLGAISELYIPVWARVGVTITLPHEPEHTLLKCECLIRRVQMIDRRPAYLLGAQFGELTSEQGESLEQLVKMIDETSD